MKVDLLESSGFCGGVNRALSILDKTILNNPDKEIYLLGPIVHNNNVNKKFEEKGVKIIDKKMISSIKKGSILVISAHGISDYFMEKIKKLDIEIVDTTCPYVLKIHNMINNHNSEPIIFIGKKSHSETIGMTEEKENIKVFESLDELKNKSSDKEGLIINQTTFNIENLDEIHEYIKNNFSNFKIYNTICPTSKENQEFFLKRNDKYNVSIIVGDKISNNANSLYELSPYPKKYFISTFDEANEIKLDKFDNCIIIGSASTPKDLIKDIKILLNNKYDKSVI